MGRAAARWTRARVHEPARSATGYHEPPSRTPRHADARLEYAAPARLDRGARAVLLGTPRLGGHGYRAASAAVRAEPVAHRRGARRPRRASCAIGTHRTSTRR